MMSYAHHALFALLLTSAVVSTVSADEPIDVVRIPKKDHAIKNHHALKEKVSTDDFVVRSPKAGVTRKVKEIKKHTPEAPETVEKSAPVHEVRKDKPTDVVRRRISP